MHPEQYKKSQIFALLSIIFNGMGWISFLLILFVSDWFETAITIYMAAFGGAFVFSLISIFIRRNRKAYIHLAIATFFLLILTAVVLALRSVTIIR